MSKTITTANETHWAQSTTTIATCWKMDLTDGTVFGFTDHDADIEYDGVMYKASTGFTPSAFESSSDMSVDGMEVQAFLDDSSITAADFSAGRFDYAEVRVFKINWASPSDGILKISRGWLGELSRQDDLFVAEVRSLTQALQQQIGRKYLGTCDADLGDSRCGVTLASFTENITVTSVTDSRIFTDSARGEADDYFNYGLLTWTSGNNDGYEMEVKDFGSGQFTLFQPMPYAVQVGDTATVYAGCDKLLSTCKDKFSNVVNFRGFPYIPGRDKVAQIE